MSKSLTTPKDIRARADKIWQRGNVHHAWLLQQSLFPLSIPIPQLSSAELLIQYADMQDAIEALKKDSEKYQYQLQSKKINHRQLGEQLLPKAAVFETESDFLRYLGKQKEFSRFKELCEHTLATWKILKEWLAKYPFKVMKFADDWLNLLAVCHHFESDPQPDCYIRQLDIKGIDTKFIESHKAILAELLEIILPEDSKHEGVKGLTNHGFERRFGLRYQQPQIRLRILDKTLAVHGLSDLTLTLEEFRKFTLETETVFIAENKVNGLAFPDFPNAIVIFGLGYAVDLLAGAKCLEKAKIYYWGDLDADGLAILSRLRKYFPKAQSLLMDEETLKNFAALSVEDPSPKKLGAEFALLTDSERKVLDKLFVYPQKARLEQERISYGYLLERLAKL